MRIEISQEDAGIVRDLLLLEANKHEQFMQCVSQSSDEETKKRQRGLLRSYRMLAELFNSAS